ncbi:hypothetical protein NI382_18330 [Vibrio parahaemolyticus]|nr:hypothetical protein NI382_18330 [Vibrio parahaemolyticus]
MKSIHALTYSLIATSIFLTGCESKNSEITGSEYVALYEQENALGHDAEALSYLTKAAEAGDVRNLVSEMPICINVTALTIRN